MNESKAMEKWEAQQLERLRAAVGPVELDEAEARILAWLAGWDTYTIDAVCSIMDKGRGGKGL